ncbi:unnamed protein product [Clonostachys byssicola]|uniref:Major facilitator superfamily (MFS) profile domain-containing protein n=1 Tax=Clonostachys byssicola TaxID=160290 RepID=A0A9N9U4I6_9HYPO|nr:unnamed protein product [Clonostachys byssicola]
MDAKIPFKEEPNQVHVEDPLYESSSELEQLTYGGKGIKGVLASPYVASAAVLASLGGFSFGYDQGVISIILVMDQFRATFPEIDPGHSSYGFNTGFMTGMLELGAFLGCLFFPYVADKISRKYAITMATAFFTVGAVIQTASHNYGTLVAGRTIGGIGVGQLAMGAPLYISEVAPPNMRGSLLVLEQFSIVFGAIVAYWVTYGTRSLAGDIAFRLPFGLQMIPALIVGLGILAFPFSPRWLAMRGRNQDCLQSLTKLRRVPLDDGRIQAEWRSIVCEVKFEQAVLEKQHPGRKGVALEALQWVDLFKPKMIRRTAIALAVSFFQQFSGINAFVYYAPTFFRALGQDNEMSLILAGMVNIIQLIGVIPVFMFLDKIGRRRLAIFGGIAMAIPHLIMSGIVSKYDGNWTSNSNMGWFGVALIYIYVLFFAMSYGPLGWTLPAEVFPSYNRAKGVGCAVAVNWLANFVIGVIVPEMLIQLGWGTYLFFGCFCIAAATFAYFVILETARKSLEEITEMFEGESLSAETELRRQIRTGVQTELAEGA